MIAYYRVSTKKQGESGLGLEAQKAAVAEHVARSGCRLVAEYTEIESGRKNARPQLRKAIAHAKRGAGTLLIAKLDRLARNLAFIANLMEAGVKFTACDNPAASEFTVHILAAVAQHEAKMISERTKAALAALKARGKILGAAGPRNLSRAGTLKGAAAAGAAHKVRKEEAYRDLLPDVEKLSAEGLSLRQIAARLNDDGQTTRRGKAWNPVQVSRVLSMASAS